MNGDDSHRASVQSDAFLSQPEKKGKVSVKYSDESTFHPRRFRTCNDMKEIMSHLLVD